jgi:2-C-methyl-D-erythritol 2,4-cyclodiphosphate synthase
LTESGKGLSSGTQVRIGQGCDTHRLAAGGPLRLGGVDIEHDQHLVGHSDADVLLHAITDALLGAAAEGDIGELFPDTDPENAGRDSAEMLRIVVERLARRRYRIGNIDCTILAQQPIMAPWKQPIRQRIAAILGINTDQIGVKAKTGEGVGPIGRGEAISAACAALLLRDLPHETRH